MIWKALSKLEQYYISDLKNIFISDVRIGVFMTGIKLSDNSYGISGTLIGSESQEYRDNRDFGNFTSNNILGKSVKDLFDNNLKETKIISSLRIAALNALSSKIINEKYKITENADPIDIIDIHTYNNIAIVGAFQSYIKKFKELNKNFKVLELNKHALKPEDIKYYAPARTFKKVFSQSDLIIITGSALINNTMDNLLKALSPKACVIVTGPSAGIVPEVLFDAGVDILGVTKIISPEKTAELVSQAATGFHFFKLGAASKICIVNPQKKINA